VPEKVDVGLAALANDPPAPLMMLQAPVPTPGVLAANVTVVSPHVAAPVWSGPAAATVGAGLTVTTALPDNPALGQLLASVTDTKV